MTTANLTINYVKENKTTNLWTWHDGYQVDTAFKKVTTFEKEKLEDILLKGKGWCEDDPFVKHCKDFGRGDWVWTLTVIDDKNAILNGIGFDGNIVKRIELK